MFIERKNIFAVVGVSADEKKWGRKVYEVLKREGLKVYAVNPKYERINNEKCYPNCTSLPEKPDVVVMVIPPAPALKVLEECVKLGVQKVWMQPGTESREAEMFARLNNINLIVGKCIVVDGLKTHF